MAAAVTRAREAAHECAFCMAPLKPGALRCRACDRAVGRRGVWTDFYTVVALTAALLFLTLIYYWALPNIRGNSAIGLVRSKEQAFLEQAMSTIRDKQYRFLGWDTQVFGKSLVLVTFTYQDTSQAQGGYMAVWWAVDPSKGTVERVKSMADFADGHLLKQPDL